MKRLTTDNPNGNFESMMNYAYAKDGKVFLRYGAEKYDIDLCEYMERVTARCEGTKAKDFEEGACLECNCDCELGILYAVATQAAELRARLKMYEDRDEPRVVIDGGKLESSVKIGAGIFGKNTHILRLCPECKSYVSPVLNEKFCTTCGQRLDWSGNNDDSRS